MSETELFGLDGLVAIVSGGSGAIGSTFAAGLADAGAKVAVLGHSRERVALGRIEIVHDVIR